MTNTAHDPSTGELPDGWGMATLGDLVQFAPKVRPELLEQNAELSFVPMKAVAEVSGEVTLDETLSATVAKKKNLTYFEDGDVIFAKITPCMENGKIARPTGLLNGSAYGSTEFHVLRAGALVDGEFLRLFLVHDDFRHEAARAMTGAVGQRRVPRKYLEAYELQLPPLAEQEQIVEILEAHLSRLDAVLEHIQILRGKAAQFRRSLLHAAFTGVLTGHDPSTGELPEGWRAYSLSQVVELESGSGTPSEDPSYPFVGMEHVAAETGRLLGSGDPRNFKSSAYLASPGQVLYGRLRPYLNKVFTPSEVCYASREFIPLVPSELIDATFLEHRLRAPDFVQFAISLNAGDRPRVKWPQMSGFGMALPPLAEQEQIVELLEAHLSRLDATLAVVDAVEERAGALRRSLLHTAFTGKLTEKWREQAHV